jgi:hypothetical protein
MTVRCLAVQDLTVDLDDAKQELPEKLRDLVEYGILASPIDPFDPMERAIQNAGNRFLDNSRGRDPGTLVRGYPLSDRLLAMANVWQQPGSTALTEAAKGAPEAIAELCHFDAGSTSISRMRSGSWQIQDCGFWVPRAHPPMEPLSRTIITRLPSNSWGSLVWRIRFGRRCRPPLWSATALDSVWSCSPATIPRLLAASPGKLASGRSNRCSPGLKSRQCPMPRSRCACGRPASSPASVQSKSCAWYAPSRPTARSWR